MHWTPAAKRLCSFERRQRGSDSDRQYVMPDHREILMEGEDQGFLLRVYLDPEKAGFEIVAARGEKICGTRFVQWMYEPRWGMDVADRAAVDRATDELLAELRK